MLNIICLIVNEDKSAIEPWYRSMEALCTIGSSKITCKDFNFGSFRTSYVPIRVLWVAPKYYGIESFYFQTLFWNPTLDQGSDELWTVSKDERNNYTSQYCSENTEAKEKKQVPKSDETLLDPEVEMEKILKRSEGLESHWSTLSFERWDRDFKKGQRVMSHSYRFRKEDSMRYDYNRKYHKALYCRKDYK